MSLLCGKIAFTLWTWKFVGTHYFFLYTGTPADRIILYCTCEKKDVPCCSQLLYSRVWAKMTSCAKKNYSYKGSTIIYIVTLRDWSFNSSGNARIEKCYYRWSLSQLNIVSSPFWKKFAYKSSHFGTLVYRYTVFPSSHSCDNPEGSKVNYAKPEVITNFKKTNFTLTSCSQLIFTSCSSSCNYNQTYDIKWKCHFS